jgi:acyl phosphate:glycerol-3-phosphate acyltransferase
MVIHDWHLFVLAYLLGSFPTAYLATRLVTGKDIRMMGDGNMGARNVVRCVGWAPGVLVGVVDILKGALAVTIAQAWRVSDGALLVVALCVTMGHDFSLFTRLRGGQGMATILGVLGALFPQETILSLAAFAVMLAFSHNWDLSCGVACAVLVGLMAMAGQPPRRLLFPFLLLPTIGGSKLIQRWQAAHLPAHASGR